MMKLIQKACLPVFAGVAMLLSGTAQAQIDYYEDFTPDTSRWTTLDFQISDVAVCDDGYAFRALPLNDLGTTIPAETVSRSLGISNGEKLTLSYQYKLLKYDPVLPYRAVDEPDWGYFYVEYGPTRNGPWKTIDIVEPVDHKVTDECSVRKVSFIPEADTEVYLRIFADAGTDLQSGYYLYIDNISALQDNLSVEPALEEKEMEVYPNPVERYLNIEVDDALVSDVVIYNSFGQQIDVPYPKGTLEQLDMSGLADGVYTIHIVADNRVKTVNVMKE